MTLETAYDPAQFERIHVRDEKSLIHLVERLADSDAVGVDVEMGQRVERRPGGVQEWTHVLALVQIASESVSALIDPLRCTDLSPLKDLMNGPARKVFLGGGQDAALLESSGVPPRNIVDVGEIALAVFGRREDGMAALARRIFDLHLDKSVRRADWMVRPLNPTLLAYAYRDAELTLLIYRWFQMHYPDAVAMHEREVLDAKLSVAVAPWITAAASLSRSAPDPLAVIMEYGFDAKRDADILADDIRVALNETQAPRLVNKLIRIASDVGLSDLLPVVVGYSCSTSSLIRTSAARAIGTLATLETGEEALLRLSQDEIGEVKSAALAALKELKAPKTPQQEEKPPDDEPSLDATSLSALQQLMQSMESDQA